MAVKTFFIPQGMFVGEVSDSVDGVFKVTQPAMVIVRQTGVSLAPFLQLVEETTIEVRLDDLAFRTFFTPKRELENHYNQVFGSGLVLSSSIP